MFNYMFNIVLLAILIVTESALPKSSKLVLMSVKWPLLSSYNPFKMLVSDAQIHGLSNFPKEKQRRRNISQTAAAAK